MICWLIHNTLRISTDTPRSGAPHSRNLRHSTRTHFSFPVTGRFAALDRVTLLRSVFDDIADQGQKLYKAGVPADEAAERYQVPEKWKNFRMFSWGFCITRTIQQFYADWGSQAKSSITAELHT